MKKNLRYLFTALLMMFGMTAMAQEVTLDFDNNIATLFPTFTSYSSGTGSSYVSDGEFNETTTTAAVDGVTATVTASDPEAGTRNRLWATNPRLRMYDGTITFTSAGEKITKMEITRTTNKNLIANQNTVDSGSLTTSDQQNNAVITWTGEAQSVTITIAGNTQFSKVVLTLGGEATVKTAMPTITPNGGEFEESIEVTLNHEDPNATILYTLNTEDWNTAKEATPGSKITLTQTTVLRAKAFDYATTWSDVVTATFTKKEASSVVEATCAEVIEGIDGTVYQVKGKCTEIKNSTFGNWYLQDETGTIYIYGTLDAQGQSRNFSSLGIEVGDIVTVQGPRKDFNGTIELVDVTVIKIEKGETQTVEKVTVAKALEIIAGLEDNKKTDKEYDVEGYIVTVDEWSPKTADGGYGNATFDINDVAGNTANVLKVFRAKNSEGGNFTGEDTPLAIGEKVVVRGFLKKYVKDDVVTPEVDQGCKVISRSTSTAISTVKTEAQQGVVYNLQGQQVMQPTKGLYIINGKKVVIK